MRKAIAIDLQYDLEVQELGLDSYSFKDDEYI